jgi:hypothetical protein
MSFLLPIAPVILNVFESVRVYMKHSSALETISTPDIQLFCSLFNTGMYFGNFGPWAWVFM